jgi:glycosyltransferase involved in cell wall biosynthesis
MLNGLARLPERLPVRLALAGSFGPEALRAKVEAHPAWKRVDWLGHISRSEVVELLRTVRAGLVLLRHEPNYMTSYPTKMFEYMAAGIPAVVSDLPLARSIVQRTDCGLVVDPSDATAVAHAIEYIMTHDSDAARMGRAGLEAVTQKYNWAAEEAKLVALYRDLTR